MTGTSRREISDWFDTGVNLNASHMLVVCDEFDYEDGPVYVDVDKDSLWNGIRARAIFTHVDVAEAIKDFTDRPMSRVHEVYSLTMDKHEQLDQEMAWNDGPRRTA